MSDSRTTPDVVDVLTADHRDVTALISEVWSVRDPMIRRDLTDTAISELVRHAVAEEMYVYPAMRKHLPDGDKAVQHDVEEHKELERAMKDLEALEVSRQRYGVPPSRRLAAGRAILDRAICHIPDVESEPEYDTAFARVIGYRSVLAAPIGLPSRSIGTRASGGGTCGPGR